MPTAETFACLHSLLVARRDDLIARWSNETGRVVASVSLAHAELLDRMPDFVDQLIAALHPGAVPLPPTGEIAEEHEVPAYVILKPGAALLETDIQDHLKGRVARYKIPKYIAFVDSYPLTASGKIQKYKLREQGVTWLKERGAEVV